MFSRDHLASKAAERLLSYDIRLIVVDDAEQLNESACAFLHALSAKTGCPLLLIGDERSLRMLASASAQLAIPRRIVLFWSRRKKCDV